MNEEKEKKQKMSADEKATFLDTMRKRREVGEQAEAHNRTKARKIIDFVYPTEDRGQWDETLFKARIDRGLLCMTLNRLPAFLNQVIGDQLQNRPQIKVRPAGLESSQKGATNREGIIRQTEQSSRAKFIVDQAYKTMCASGYPTHWQVNSRYVSEDSFDQEIVWQAIEDQYSVVRDPYAQENDRRDANWLFLLETISEDEFKRRYPKKDIPKSDENSITEYNKWFGDAGKAVTLAVYWRRKSKKRTLCALKSNGRTWWKDAPPEEIKVMIEKGTYAEGSWQERESDDWTTDVSVCSGTEILEEPQEKPWKWIPVVDLIPPYIIKDDGKRWYRALVEDSIDPQRYYNYWKSMSAQGIKAKPPYVTAAMIKGLEAWWDRKDKSDLEYLPVNSDGAQWPHDNPPPQVSTALVQAEQGAIEDIKATMGMWNPSLGASEQSLSGKAIGKLQMAGDKGNLEYVNSLVQALTFTGDIILDMAPHVLDTPREIPILGFDGTPSKLMINQADGPIPNPDTDMKIGKYRSVVDVGPSFTTQRQEALDGMVAITQGNPQIAAVLAPFMAKFGDWPYAEKIFEILKALQPPNIQALYDDNEEGPDPQIAAMQAQFEEQMAALMAQLEQAGATVQELQAAVGEMKSALVSKEQQLVAMKSDFDLAKREVKVQADEQALMGKGAEIGKLSKEIEGIKSVVESMDRGLAAHISKSAAKSAE